VYCIGKNDYRKHGGNDRQKGHRNTLADDDQLAKVRFSIWDLRNLPSESRCFAATVPVLGFESTLNGNQ